MTVTDDQLADAVIDAGFIDPLSELEPDPDVWSSHAPDEQPAEPLFIDVAEILAKGLPKPG